MSPWILFSSSSSLSPSSVGGLANIKMTNAFALNCDLTVFLKSVFLGAEGAITTCFMSHSMVGESSMDTFFWSKRLKPGRVSSNTLESVRLTAMLGFGRFLIWISCQIPKKYSIMNYENKGQVMTTMSWSRINTSYHKA